MKKEDKVWRSNFINAKKGEKKSLLVWSRLVLWLIWLMWSKTENEILLSKFSNYSDTSISVKHFLVPLESLCPQEVLTLRPKMVASQWKLKLYPGHLLSRALFIEPATFLALMSKKEVLELHAPDQHSTGKIHSVCSTANIPYFLSLNAIVRRGTCHAMSYLFGVISTLSPGCLSNLHPFVLGR